MTTDTNQPVTLLVGLGPSHTGLTTVGYKLVAGDGTTFQTRRTTGVYEIGGGWYGVQVADTVFTDAFDGRVDWDIATVYQISEDIHVNDAGSGGGGGGGGDPWATELPADYSSDEAGGILAAIAAKTGLITTGTEVTLVAPVLASGGVVIVTGDDYKAVDGRALGWSSDSWPVLTAAAIALDIENTSDTDDVASFAGSVVSATEARVELDAGDTDLTAGTWRYALRATLSGGDVVTLAAGPLVVSTKP